VPWNNNPAEHAVKAFAQFRRIADGLMSERGLSDYLVLLSFQQTCKYRGVSFFEFLRSREEDVGPFCDRPRRKHAPATIDVYPEVFIRTFRKQASEQNEAKRGERSRPIGAWKLAVLRYLRGNSEAGAYFREIADHCFGLIREGTLETTKNSDDRRRVEQNRANVLYTRKQVGDVVQTPNKLFHITEQGMAVLERQNRRSQSGS
jgi:hypothetical protein